MDERGETTVGRESRLQGEHDDRGEFGARPLEPALAVQAVELGVRTEPGHDRLNARGLRSGIGEDGSDAVRRFGVDQQLDVRSQCGESLVDHDERVVVDGVGSGGGYATSGDVEEGSGASTIRTALGSASARRRAMISLATSARFGSR